MNRLEVFSIEGKGDLTKECVWLDVKKDINALQHYLLSDSTFLANGDLSNELRHVYWFPNMAVGTGDYIKLSTGTGTYSTTVNKRKTTTHLLYWGLGRTVWNKDGDSALLFKLEGWKVKNG